MSESKPCGLYRTTAAHPERGDAVPAGVLVYFHNHSTQGPPIIQLPEHNQHNRWTFHESGFLAADPDWLATLAAMKSQGFYRLREHFHPDPDRVVPANTLVQLGYTRAAEPILFFPQPHAQDNALVFPTQGMRVPAPVYALLEPLSVRGPVKPTAVH